MVSGSRFLKIASYFSDSDSHLSTIDILPGSLEIDKPMNCAL